MKDELFEEFLEGVRQGGAILRGELKPARATRIEAPNVKQIRKELGLTQEQFAALLGISVGTLRGWEQKRRNPEGPARALLQVAASHPEAVLDALSQTS